VGEHDDDRMWLLVLMNRVYGMCHGGWWRARTGWSGSSTLIIVFCDDYIMHKIIIKMIKAKLLLLLLLLSVSVCVEDARSRAGKNCLLMA
jgi:hypothetical protein